MPRVRQTADKGVFMRNVAFIAFYTLVACTPLAVTGLLALAAISVLKG